MTFGSSHQNYQFLANISNFFKTQKYEISEPLEASKSTNLLSIRKNIMVRSTLPHLLPWGPLRANLGPQRIFGRSFSFM